MLLGALGAAGTPGAQDSLLGGVREAVWSERQTETALSSLIQLEHPVSAWDDALIALHERGGECAPMAYLVLGALGDRVRTQDADRYETIRARLIQAASVGQGLVDQRITALEALGNLSQGEVPPPVRTGISDPEPPVRSAALRALSRTDSAEALALVRRAALEDASATVRAVALEVAREQPGPAQIALHARILGTDDVEDVRHAALQGLAEHLDDPAAVRAVERAATGDASPDLRRAALDLLAQRAP